MEPYLPSEINLLVLRHLAREGCSKTIGCYISESSSIKELLSSNGNVDNIEAIRQKLTSPSVNGGLVHVLSDYGRAKLLLNDLITKLLDRKVLMSNYLSPFDSLCTQIAHISKLVELKCKPIMAEDKNVGTSDYLPPENASSSEQIVVHDLTTDVMEFPGHPGIPGETEEKSLQLPVSIATFMDEFVLNRIVSIANKELQRGTQQAESEIDKILMDILCGVTGEALPKTILDASESTNRDSTETPTVESNLMTLFQEDQSSMANTSIPPIEDSGTQQGASGSLVDSLETPNKCNFTSSIYTPISKSSSNVRTSDDAVTTTSSEPSQIPVTTPCAQGSSQAIIPQYQQPTATTTTAVPVKSPKKVVTKHYSIIPIAPASSATCNNQWKKLHRREITPKIGVNNNRLMALKNDSPNKRKATSSPVKLTPEKALNTDLNFMCVAPSSRHAKEILQRVNLSISSSAEDSRLGDVDESETNIPLIDIEAEGSSCQNSLSTINYNDLLSSAQKQERISIGEKPKTKNLSFTVTTTSQQLQQQQNETTTTVNKVVTPIPTTVQMQEASTTPNTMPNNVSGGADGEKLTDSNEKMCTTRLLSSARCTRQNPLSILEKKSYSTPRKKKHIRNLMFKTPPGARSERTENNSNKFLTSPSTKRKSSDLLPDFKSRKKLKWDRSNKDGKQSEKMPLAPIPEAVVSTTESPTAATPIIQTPTTTTTATTITLTPTPATTTTAETTTTTVILQSSHSSPVKNLRQSPKGIRHCSRLNKSSLSKSPLRRILPKPVPHDYPTTAFTPILHDQPSEYVLSIPSNSPLSRVNSVTTTSISIDSSSSGNSSLEFSTSLPPTPGPAINTLGGDRNTQRVDPGDKSLHYPNNFLTSTPLKLGPPRTPIRDISVLTAPLNADRVSRNPSIFDTPLKPQDNNLNMTSNSFIRTNSTLSSSDNSLSRNNNSKNNNQTNKTDQLTPRPARKSLLALVQLAKKSSSSSPIPPSSDIVLKKNLTNTRTPPSSDIVSKKNVNKARTQLANPSSTTTSAAKKATIQSNKLNTHNSFQFEVSGRKKSLTISEQESLIGLLQIGRSKPTTRNPHKSCKDGSMTSLLGF